MTRCFYFVLWTLLDGFSFCGNNCCCDCIWRAGWNKHQPAYKWQKLKIFSSLNFPKCFHVTTFILGIFNTSCSRCLLRSSSELKYAASLPLKAQPELDTRIYKSHFFSIPWCTTMAHLSLLSMRKLITFTMLYSNTSPFCKCQTRGRQELGNNHHCVKFQQEWIDV